MPETTFKDRTGYYDFAEEKTNNSFSSRKLFTISGELDEKSGNEINEENDHTDHRGNWSKGIEFLLSCISISIGLGNVWRFPSLAYENGGGVFLIPYFILLFIMAKPLYYMELAIGQFASSSPVKVWNCLPGFKGIGFAQMLSTFFLTTFYNFIMCLTIFYTFASMQSKLPWTWCDPDWADNSTCYNRLKENQTDSVRNQTASEQYFRRYVLNQVTHLEDMSTMDWRLVLCLLLSWTIVFLATVRGVQSLGKVVYVTATYPYIVLISLLAVAMQKQGSVEGLVFFFKPEWKKLLDIEVWYKACEQSFFSLNTGFGHLIMYASYNNFRHNVHRDALIISVADTLTSVLAGSVVFSVLGTLAHDLGQDISTVAKDSGLTLAFITYPEALSQTPFVPQLWAVLFFIMLYMLGLGSAIGHIEAIVTTIKDEFPHLHQKKSFMALSACLACFICGLPMTTNAGEHVINLLDNYGVGAAVFLYAVLEITGIMWIYGYRRLLSDIHFMLGSPVGWFWKWTWILVAPVTLIFIYGYGTVMLAIGNATKEDDSNDRLIMPAWGTAIGWILAMLCIIQIPFWFVVTVVKAPGSTVLEKFKLTFQPTPEWGPRNPTLRKEWEKWNEKKIKEQETQSAQYTNPSFKPDDV
ncbi:sodium-dependent nutrient amino acid transporter 1-like [Tachypleus tridentatus]|uniref:sodium-dependent nutrient amino acid transporter 1-like n=1 Tax=Tachypleus tridentatus TaxID=6853 RepID=UPI003FCF30C5